jgi:ABC-2 type transport system permease protein
MRQEIYKTLRSPGYVIVAFIIPLVAVLLLAGIQFFQGRSGGGGVTASAPSPSKMDIEGYVDLSGLIRIVPDNIPPDHLLSFANEKMAQQALASGQIAAYYVIPPDYVPSGRVYYVYPDTRSYLDDGQSWVMSWTLLVNLLEGDAQLADRVWNPAWNVTTSSIAPQAQSGRLAEDDCSRPGANCESNELIRYMPSIMVAIFFLAFMASSSRLFNSIGTEKENRTIEVLMLSLNPRQLLAGKTLGLGIASILQTIVWLGAIYISFNLGGSTLRLPDNFVFPADILIWSLVFFLGGYGLYASLMAGAGALVPKMKEAGVANYIATFPLFLGYAFGLMSPLAKAADSAFLVFLSFFPLTSPIVMVMRVTASTVPLWQLLLSTLLLFVTTYFILRAVADMFQAQNLLSGQPFSVRRYLAALAGRR